MSYEMSRKRLRHYFGNITYIDDQFDHCLVQEPVVVEATDTEGPPLPAGAPSPSEGNAHEDARKLTSEERSGINLRHLLEALNDDKYDGIRLHPVVYSSSSSDEKICSQISKAPFTIIDWNLDDQKKAYSIINKLFDETQQLKVIVVYTANYIEALNTLDTDTKLSQNCSIPTKHPNFAAYLCNNRSLLVVAAKQDYNILSLLDIVTELFIENCGIMPIAMLNFMESAQNLSDKLVSDFSHPFADLYYLQMHFSERAENDAPEAITLFLQNKLREECSVDAEIVDDLFTFQKNRLKKYMESPNAEEKLKECIGQLQSQFRNEAKDYCIALSDVDFSCFKDCCHVAIENAPNWTAVLHSFAPFFKEGKHNFVLRRVNNMIQPYLGVPMPFVIEKLADNHKTELYKTVQTEIADDFAEFEKQTAPILIQMVMSSADLLDKGTELVKNLKYKNYPDPSLSKLLVAGKEMESADKAVFLQNKLHFGDILIKYDKQHGNKYLFCISPPCDIFHPGKTNLNILFLKGTEVHPNSIPKKKRENTHLSALPVKCKGNKIRIRYINWRFYDIVKFNLEDPGEYEALCDWQRPCMMTDSYARQISNLFIAHFSRAGVDELFIKSEDNLRQLFWKK